MTGKSKSIDDTRSDDTTDTDVDDDAIDDDADDEFSSTVVLRENNNVGDMSVEINVEELVADIKKATADGENTSDARRRLESLIEEKRQQKLLDDLDTFDVDDK